MTPQETVGRLKRRLVFRRLVQVVSAAVAVPSIRAVLAERLAVRATEISQEITQLTLDKIDRSWLKHVERERVRQSTSAHMDVVAFLLTHPEDLESAEPPVGAISTVRELARQGLPLHEIIRSYQLSNARWFQICTATLATLTPDVNVLASESVALSRLSSDYLDRMCERIAEEYDDERQRWLRQEESVRLERVLALLEGGLTEHDAERALGYRLRQKHLALIAWVGDTGETHGDESLRAQRAVASVAGVLDIRARPFTVAPDARTVWSWLPQPARTGTIEELQQAVAAIDDEVRLAVGAIGGGLGGFIRSYQQASAAYEVGRVSTAASVFPYREVSALAFLVGQPERARLWAEETLGDLVGERRRDRVLRETLEVYLRSQQSATGTARELNCHKNTILYRLRLAEQLLGKTIESDAVNIGLALQAYRWVGQFGNGK